MRGDRLFGLLFSAASACSWLAGALVLMAEVSVAVARPLPTAIAIALLVLLPLVHQRVLAMLADRSRARIVAGGLLVLLHPLPLLLLPEHEPSSTVLVAVVMLLVGHAQSRPDLTGRDLAAARFLFLAAFGMPVLALCLHASLAELALVPIGATLAVTGLVMLEGRLARSCVRHRSLEIGGSSTGGVEAPDADRGRLGFAAGVSVIVITAGLAGLAVRSTIPLLEAIPTAGAEDPELDPEEEQDLASTEEGWQESDRRDSRFENDLELGSNRGAAVSDEPALLVRVLEGEPPRENEVLYLRGRVLDTFTSTGVTLSGPLPRTRRDEADGVGDGWVQLQSRQPVMPRTLEVEQLVAFDLPSAAGQVAFLPDRAFAVQATQVRYGEDSFCTLPTRMSGRAIYGVRYEEESPGLRELASAEVDDNLTQLLQLPPDSPALGRIVERAQEWIPREGGDLERILTLILTFRREFEYDTVGTGFVGPDAIEAFLERRSGYCSYFATSAALMLRSQGIPARLVTGFMLSERDEEEPGTWVGRRRHAHVWIEVPFEGVGWVSFDPTPGVSGRADGLVGDGRDELEQWLAALRRWAQGDPDGVGLGRLAAGLVGAAWLQLRQNPLLLLLPSAGLLGLLALLRSRRRLADAPRTLELDAREAGPLRRLLAVLEGRGLRPRRGQTLLGFATSAGEREQDLEELPSIISLFYRSSFGSRPLQQPELERVEAFIERLEGRAPATG